MTLRKLYHRRCYAVLVFGLALSATSCGGGGSDGNITLATGTQTDDPVVVEVPIAYIRRPGAISPVDLRDPLSFNPGAELFVRGRSATSAEDINLTSQIARRIAEQENVDIEDLAIDIKDLASSFDGNIMIFAARGVLEPIDENLNATTWNLWTYNFSDNSLDYLIPSRIKRNEGLNAGGGHDIAPAFLPDDRVVFSSTRQVINQERLLNEGRSQLFSALDEDGDDPAAVLHVYDPQQRNAEFTQVSFNLSHDLDPTVLSSGKIVFSRWNNTATDHISLYEVRPDGLGLAPLYGFHSQNTGSDGNAITYTQPMELDDGRLATVAKPFRSPTMGGNIFIIDALQFADQNQPNWLNSTMQGEGQSPLTDTGIRTDSTLSTGGQFGSVYPLRDGTSRLLVTWSDCRVIDNTAEDASRVLPCKLQPDNNNAAESLYGGWVYNPQDNTQRPIVIPEEGFQITELIAAESRTFPDVVTRPENFEEALAQQDMGLVHIDSVYDLDGVDNSPSGIASHATPGSSAHETRPARFLRILQPVPIPDRDVFEIPGFASGVAGGNRFREILGYALIEPDGSATFTAPANRPFSFSVLDERGRRVGPAHNYWLQVGAGESVSCTGCHDHNSGLPHGAGPRMQPVSSNPGAVSIDSVLGFAGTDRETLFASEAGQSMAQVWDFHRPLDNPAASARSITLSPQYRDDWHASDIEPDDPILDRDYRMLWPDIPAERSPIVNSFDPEQPPRIVINYIDHIQPIWERSREARLNTNNVPIENCVGCHNTTGNAVVPPGQLDLTASASDINADHLRSYRELLSQDQEQWLNLDNALTDRVRECTEVTENGDTVTTTQTVPVSPPARAGSANASSRFFGCFEDNECGRPPSPPLPANCTEDGGTIVPATRNTVDHTGLLSEAELHLISEWLDIGGQYYNNPFDPRLSD